MRAFVPKTKAIQRTPAVWSTNSGRGHLAQPSFTSSNSHFVQPTMVSSEEQSLRTPAEGRLTTTSSTHFAQDFRQIPLHPVSTVHIQPKRTVSRPQNIDEQEADHIANQVMHMPAPQWQPPVEAAASIQARRVQVSPHGSMTAPTVVHEVLASPGRPLDLSTRRFMEPRFGRDFSHVRVHTDSKAAQSADQVQAFAYTVSHDVVFGAGRYTPTSSQGRKLLAHELAHVVQQSETSPRLQRFAACETSETCPDRDPGELLRSRKEPMLVGSIPALGSGLFISGFAIGSRSPKSDLTTNPAWKRFVAGMASNTSVHWNILGFSDCQGADTTNESLRQQRATAIASALSQSARAQVDSVVGAPLSDCIASNDSEKGRTYNRSVLFRPSSTDFDFEPEEQDRVIGKKRVKFWINAFIPNYLDGTRKVPAGHHSGETMFEGPWPYNCFLTDNRGFSNRITASARIHAEATVETPTGKMLSSQQFSSGTTELDCDNGEMICFKVATVHGGFDSPQVDSGIITVPFKFAASDPCVSVAPDVDLNGKVIIEPLADRISIEGLIEPFPAFEMYMTVDGGSPTTFFKFFDVAQRPWVLFGDPNVKVRIIRRLE